MPITIHYTKDNTGVNFFAVDEVSGKDIISSMKKLFASEHFKNLKYWIVDRSLCTKYKVSSEEVMLIADLDKEAAKINPDILHALVSHTDLQFGMSRMYEIQTGEDGFKTRIFKVRSDAEAWINEELAKA
jgi:hypothetical protein